MRNESSLLKLLWWFIYVEYNFIMMEWFTMNCYDMLIMEYRGCYENPSDMLIIVVYLWPLSLTLMMGEWWFHGIITYENVLSAGSTRMAMTCDDIYFSLDWKINNLPNKFSSESLIEYYYIHLILYVYFLCKGKYTRKNERRVHDCAIWNDTRQTLVHIFLCF